MLEYQELQKGRKRDSNPHFQLIRENRIGPKIDQRKAIFMIKCGKKVDIFPLTLIIIVQLMFIQISFNYIKILAKTIKI